MLNRNMAVRKGFTIPGQTWLSELYWLYDTCRKSKSHAEIGVFCGRSLYASCAGMIDRCSVYAVDHETPSVGDEFSPGIGWTNAVLNYTCQAIRENNKNVALRRMSCGSLQAAKSLQESNVLLDSVFIDALHEYCDVVADISEWLPLIKPGGLICGHDYSTAHRGVMDAVNEVLPGFSVVPDTRIWYKQIGA